MDCRAWEYCWLALLYCPCNENSNELQQSLHAAIQSNTQCMSCILTVCACKERSYADTQTYTTKYNYNLTNMAHMHCSTEIKSPLRITIFHVSHICTLALLPDLMMCGMTKLPPPAAHLRQVLVSLLAVAPELISSLGAAPHHRLTIHKHSYQQHHHNSQVDQPHCSRRPQLTEPICGDKNSLVACKWNLFTLIYRIYHECSQHCQL